MEGSLIGMMRIEEVERDREIPEMQAAAAMDVYGCGTVADELQGEGRGGGREQVEDS
jgi:hypothetical protein